MAAPSARTCTLQPPPLSVLKPGQVLSVTYRFMSALPFQFRVPSTVPAGGKSMFLKVAVPGWSEKGAPSIRTTRCAVGGGVWEGTGLGLEEPPPHERNPAEVPTRASKPMARIFKGDLHDGRCVDPQKRESYGKGPDISTRPFLPLPR